MVQENGGGEVLMLVVLTGVFGWRWYGGFLVFMVIVLSTVMALLEVKTVWLTMVAEMMALWVMMYYCSGWFEW